MNSMSLRPIVIALTLASACALLMTLGGCTGTIQSNPTTFSVLEGAAPALRGQQRIALKNAYKAETIVTVQQVRGSTALADLKQYTDTAISMLERQMTKDGITIDATATKSITLRVRDMTVTTTMYPFVAVMNSSLTLEARLGEGTTTAFRTESSSAGGPARAFDGAVVLAVTSLLNDKEFQAYVNQATK